MYIYGYPCNQTYSYIYSYTYGETERGREQTTGESREQRRENDIHAIILGKKKLENTADQKCIVIKLC